MINILGRTKEQQEQIELSQKDSLWPRFEILHKYIFTKSEFNLIKKAKEIIRLHKEKINSIC